MTTATSSSGGESSTGEQDTTETLQEQIPELPCTISESATVVVDKKIQIDEEGIITESEYGRPYWDTIEVTGYFCNHCHEEFDTEELAREHLKEQYRLFQQRHRLLPQQTDADARVPSYDGKVEEFESGQVSVEGIKGPTNATALVTNGVGALLITSRRSLSLPTDLDFDDWAPLNGGVLTYPKGTPRIDKRLLHGAIIYLSNDTSSVTTGIEESKFTLHDRGHSFVLTGTGQTILIAEKIPREYK